MMSRARCIWSLGAGQMISPSSSLTEGVRWYSGSFSRGFFAGLVWVVEPGVLRFMVEAARAVRGGGRGRR